MRTRKMVYGLSVRPCFVRRGGKRHSWDDLGHRDDDATHVCAACGMLVESGSDPMDGECSGILGVYDTETSRWKRGT